MSQATTWGFPLAAEAPKTPTVVAAQADDSFDALLSSHSGAARPAYSVAGTVWMDSGADQWYLYDGTTDWPIGHEYLKSDTALADAAATLTAAQLLAGLFTITPTAARIQTTDTAVAILAAMPPHVDGSSFEFTIANLAAFDVTLAAGVGVTLVGNLVANNASATFLVYRTAAATVTMVRK
jgi:hypothetical protein